MSEKAKYRYSLQPRGDMAYSNLLYDFQMNHLAWIESQLAHHILMGDKTWEYKDPRVFVHNTYQLDFDIEIHGNMLINMRGQNGTARTA